MNTREKKTAKELEEMIMREVRRHSTLSDVQDVLIAENPEPHPPNWRPEFVMDGPGHRPVKALQIATDLGMKFDRA
jgi:hypothetical protein